MLTGKISHVSHQNLDKCYSTSAVRTDSGLVKVVGGFFETRVIGGECGDDRGGSGTVDDERHRHLNGEYL